MRRSKPSKFRRYNGSGGVRFAWSGRIWQGVCPPMGNTSLSIIFAFLSCSPHVVDYILWFVPLIGADETLYIGLWTMGIKPKPTENPNACPYGPWANGKEPDYILATVSGMIKGNNWSSSYGEPPNGLYILKYLVCGVFLVRPGWPQLNFLISTGDAEFSLGIDGLANVFYATGPIQEVMNMFNASSVYPEVFVGGIAEIQTFYDGYSPPEIWAPASLIGVPAVEGYFAEKPGSDPNTKGYRYASHFDGTNVHILLE